MEKLKIRRFLEGLVFPLYNSVAGQVKQFATYVDAIDCARMIEFRRIKEKASLKKEPDRLRNVSLVTTLEGESMLVEYVYKSCVISMEGRETLADLMVLDMIDFDVIFGMDWLALCHATLDCHLQMIKYNILG